jgi:hypothetical protein
MLARRPDTRDNRLADNRTLPMRWDERFYCHEDVYLRPGMAATYLASQGRQRSWSEAHNNTLVGIFAQLRPLGNRWPRAVNLWESSWRRKVGALNEQFGPDHGPRPANDKELDTWWRRGAGHRAGGWDRLMLPGPGSPPLEDLQQGPLLRAVVQQLVRLKKGAQPDYLAWFGESVPQALAGSAWRALMWLGPLHSSSAIVYYGAESWDRVCELGERLPQAPAAWEPLIESSALKPWEHSDYLKREAR